MMGFFDSLIGLGSDILSAPTKAIGSVLNPPSKSTARITGTSTSVPDSPAITGATVGENAVYSPDNSVSTSNSSRDYSTTDYSNRSDNSSRDYSTTDYSNRSDNSSRDYSTTDYSNRSDNSSRDYSTTNIDYSQKLDGGAISDAFLFGKDSISGIVNVSKNAVSSYQKLAEIALNNSSKEAQGALMFAQNSSRSDSSIQTDNTIKYTMLAVGAMALAMAVRK